MSIRLAHLSKLSFKLHCSLSVESSNQGYEKNITVQLVIKIHLSFSYFNVFNYPIKSISPPTILQDTFWRECQSYYFS